MDYEFGLFFEMALEDLVLSKIIKKSEKMPKSSKIDLLSHSKGPLLDNFDQILRFLPFFAIFPIFDGLAIFSGFGQKKIQAWTKVRV